MIMIYENNDFILLFVQYPINVKTVEPIGPNFCGEPHMALWKVYD